jgi:hypothetical protein
LEARWQFGKALLRRRVSKKLPKGLLDDIIAEHHISRSEIQYRMQFAETFPTKAELSTAVDNHGSWREVRKALPKSPQGRRPAKRLGEIDAAGGEPVPVLDRVVEQVRGRLQDVVRDLEELAVECCEDEEVCSYISDVVADIEAAAGRPARRLRAVTAAALEGGTP